jgi:hypothetical protein
MKLVNWGTSDGRRAWEASIEGKRLGQLWNERAVDGKEMWAARMKIERRNKIDLAGFKKHYDEVLIAWQKDKALREDAKTRASQVP